MMVIQVWGGGVVAVGSGGGGVVQVGGFGSGVWGKGSYVGMGGEVDGIVLQIFARRETKTKWKKMSFLHVNEIFYMLSNPLYWISSKF